MKSKCIDCGKEVDYRQIRCLACYNKSRENWVPCIKCMKKFKASPSQKRMYCSKKCEGLARTGSNNPFYGKQHTKKTKKAISLANKGRKINIGKDNPMWKEFPSCGSLHTWIRRNKPKPQFCEKCGIKKPKEVALKKGLKHQRNINSYDWLCIKCHRKNDRGWKWSEKQKEKIRYIVVKRQRNSKGRFI